MSNGLNLNSIMNVAMFAAGFVTGGATWAALAQQVFQQVASQAFSGALSQLGINGLANELATAAFSRGMGCNGGDEGIAQSLIDEVRNAGNHADGLFTGDLDRAQADLQDGLQTLLNQLMRGEIERSDEGREGEGQVKGGKSGGAGNNSWLMAIAEALGEVAGKKASDLVGKSFELQSINERQIDKDDQAGLQQQAQEFAIVNSQYQALAQEFSIVQSTISTTLKAIGEGISQVARKQ